jgi:hypothetical protein
MHRVALWAWEKVHEADYAPLGLARKPYFDMS